MTTTQAAIKNWEANNEGAAADSSEVKLCLQTPPITKLDTKVLGSLKSCQKVSQQVGEKITFVSQTHSTVLVYTSISRIAFSKHQHD